MRNSNKETTKSSFWWFLILVFGPISMLWENCSYRPIVQKRNALIEVNCSNVKTMSDKEIELAYQYGVDNGWFKK